MKTINVNIKERSYKILIGARLNKLGNFLQKITGLGKNTMVISDTNAGKIYAKEVLKSLQNSGFKTNYTAIPAGEEHKNIYTIIRLFDAAAKAGFDRYSPVIALGGGVVGDIAGFLSATYLRGIPFIQVPTTLLAMVDASIGGKTGVDLPQGKNLAGAFHQPKMVFIDTGTLRSLPEKEWRNGMAEIIKYGIIADKQLFLRLENISPPVLYGNHILLEQIIAACCAIKAGVVSKDERETKGLREILNFGHTVGHALETASKYRTISHGQAVAIGMCAAGYISERMGLWPAEYTRRLISVITRFGLPSAVDHKIDRKNFLAALHKDKKAKHGSVRFVLPRQIGQVELRNNVDSHILEESLKKVIWL